MTTIDVNQVKEPPKPAKADSVRSPRPYMIAGYLVVILIFGVLGGWAATAKIASAVVSTGVVSLEGNRKVVQHLEGGIVRDIHVREADFVEQGDVLITMETVEAETNLQLLRQRQLTNMAAEARLLAERDQSETISFPQELLVSEDFDVIAALESQRSIFDDRRSILASRTDILETRITQLERQIEGLSLQQDAYERRLELRTELIERLTGGAKRGVIEGNRVNDLQDGLIQIEAQLGAVITDIASAENSIGETRLNLIQVRQEYSERASVELKEVQDELREVQERIKVAEDQLNRTEIRAPSSGTVQNVSVSTEGSVIRPGEILMEIVPQDEELIINAQISPIDIDQVVPGLETEVRFSAFKSGLTPVILGEVQSVSGDTITEDENTPPYYLARVHVDEEDMPENIREGLTAGMPVDVVIATGERSVFYYIIQPLADAVAKSVREE